MSAPGERALAIAADYGRKMPIGMIAEKYDIQRPAVWKALRRAGVLAPYQPRDGAAAKPKPSPPQPIRKMSPDDIARRVVSRDPCRRCGVRGDIGCIHQPLTEVQA